MMLYENYPELPEGELTKMRAGLVCEQALADDARKLGIGDWLQLGKGEEKTGGREKESILADAMEALIGAVFLDGGSSAVKAFIYRYVSFDTDGQGFYRDRKTELQERLQCSGKAEIRYITEELSHDDQEKAFVQKLAQAIGVSEVYVSNLSGLIDRYLDLVREMAIEVSGQ